MRFTFYLINSYLKELSDELLQRQKHEVIIDHEEFMTERYSQSSSSENQSTDRQSFSITENLKHFDEPRDELSNESLVESSNELSIESSVKFSVESSVKSSVESSLKSSVESPDETSVRPLDEPAIELSDESLVDQSSFKPPTSKNQRRSVERSDESSISSSHSSALPTSVNQSGGQSRRQLMKQLIRRAIIGLDRKFAHLDKLYTNETQFTNAAIHVRCGID
jgi:hypothetical protein